MARVRVPALVLGLGLSTLLLVSACLAPTSGDGAAGTNNSSTAPSTSSPTASSDSPGRSATPSRSASSPASSTASTGTSPSAVSDEYEGRRTNDFLRIVADELGGVPHYRRRSDPSTHEVLAQYLSGDERRQIFLRVYFAGENGALGPVESVDDPYFDTVITSARDAFVDEGATDTAIRTTTVQGLEWSCAEGVNPTKNIHRGLCATVRHGRVIEIQPTEARPDADGATSRAWDDRIMDELSTLVNAL
ncbi:hypothetical protein [Propionibacterium australiense]|uniref:Prokaryotic membrane lipoprotein lipid attachment site profile n=1 Tax=Propionibacterium australiense TaxID=119981 RepID=A0A8B3FJA0_9ACTN|nr:hypothetical protein [Propionibacterium australiense]RLP09886.1 hypothetical protein D7U36_06820 [Propionibacterium australiense]